MKWQWRKPAEDTKAGENGSLYLGTGCPAHCDVMLNCSKIKMYPPSSEREEGVTTSRERNRGSVETESERDRNASLRRKPSSPRKRKGAAGR